MKKFMVLCLCLGLVLFTGCFSSQGKTENQAAAANKQFPAFTTKDLNGNTVTNDIFKGKKVTVINIWGTFCPPCIEEMPELGKWEKEMPKDAQIIGIVCDAENENDAKTAKEAVKILDKANVKFVNLLPSKEIIEYLQNVQAVPTTIFVDSEGKILGDSVVGANVPKYKDRVAEYLK